MYVHSFPSGCKTSGQKMSVNWEGGGNLHKTLYAGSHTAHGHTVFMCTVVETEHQKIIFRIT